MKELIVSLFLMAIPLSGALAVLYILHLMEDTSLAFCFAAFLVFAVTTFLAVSVALNRG